MPYRQGCCFLAVEYGIPMSVQALLTPGVEAAQVNGLRRSYVCACDLVPFVSGGEKSSRFHTSASEEVRGFFRHCSMLKGFWNDTLGESLWLYKSLWLKYFFVTTTCSNGCGTLRLGTLSGSIRAFGRCCNCTLVACSTFTSSLLNSLLLLLRGCCASIA